MKFLIDAQLPQRLARVLIQSGHDAVHTCELPDANTSTDAQIVAAADGQQRVVVTKDRDFRDEHLLKGAPRKLLIVATGNINNCALLMLFESHLDVITSALQEADFVELGATFLVVHQRRNQPEQS